MKANELMIGDWVLMDMNYSEDDPMYTRLDYQPYQIQNGEDIDLAEETNCIGDASVYQPIPLTPEILEKNGFVYNEIPFVLSYEQFGLSIYGIQGSYHINCGQNVSMDVSYIHQLQHALRLCKIDKEIVP